MIEEFKQLLQDFLAPKLEAINGEIKSLGAQIAAQEVKFDAKFALLQTMIEATRREFIAEIKRIEEKFTAEIRANSAEIHANSAEIRAVVAEIKRVEQKFDAEIRRVEGTLSADFVRMEGQVDTRLVAMTDKVESVRRELLAELKAAAHVS